MRLPLHLGKSFHFSSHFWLLFLKWLLLIQLSFTMLCFLQLLSILCVFFWDTFFLLDILTYTKPFFQRVSNIISCVVLQIYFVNYSLENSMRNKINYIKKCKQVVELWCKGRWNTVFWNLFPHYSCEQKNWIAF